MFHFSGRHTSHEHIIVIMFLNDFSGLWDYSHLNSHDIAIISIFLAVLSLDFVSRGRHKQHCFRLMQSDPLARQPIRSGSCWHERWEPPWAVVHPTFEEEERQDLCGQAETYRANARAVPLLWVSVGLNCFFILARRLDIAGEQRVSVPCLAPAWLLCWLLYQ